MQILQFLWANCSRGLENLPAIEGFLETCLFLFMVFSNEMENSLFPSSLQQFLIYLKPYYM